jgi:hypothetical protein
MRLSSVKIVGLAMFVAALGFVGVAARNAYADGCPPENCNAPSLGCHAVGYCEDRPWGSIRCLSGPSGGHYEGFMYQDCQGRPVRYF